MNRGRNGDVMICAGEASGEMYGSALARELSRRNPDRRLFGMGGARMADAGVEIIASMNPVVGLVEILEHLKELRAALVRLKRAIRERKPGLLVLIDNPEFNLRLAATARQEGVPVMYYVSPQVWAWRKGRARKIARMIDGIAVILPFEKSIYEDLGVRTVYTGHPIVEQIQQYLSAPSEAESLVGSDRPGGVLAVLPGSRSGEIRLHADLLAQTLALLRNRLPELTPVVPLAPGLSAESRERLRGLAEAGAVLTERSSWDVFRAARVALVASGTASLEASVFEIPTVVFYRLKGLSYLIGKMLIDVPHVSLTNLLLEDRVIPEFLQDEATPDALAEAVVRLERDEGARRAMKDAFLRVKEILGRTESSARAADLAEEIAAC